MAYMTKRKCRICNEFVPPRELTAGKCFKCWQEQRSAHDSSMKGLDNFRQGESYKCMECGDLIGPHLPKHDGYLHWVMDAGRFALFCIPCSDKKYAKDSQYRNTAFAFASKIQ